MKKAIVVIFSFLVGLAIAALVWGGIVWVLCWLLKAIGIATIGSWTVAFSWKLTLLVALVYKILESIFAQRKSN